VFGHSLIGFSTFFRGLAVVLGESREGKGVVTAFQPADLAERISEAIDTCETIERYTCNANCVTVVGMGICPRP